MEKYFKIFQIKKIKFISSYSASSNMPYWIPARQQDKATGICDWNICLTPEYSEVL